MRRRERRKLRRRLVRRHPAAAFGSVVFAAAVTTPVYAVIDALLPSDVTRPLSAGMMGLAVGGSALWFDRRYLDPAIERAEVHASTDDRDGPPRSDRSSL